MSSHYPDEWAERMHSALGASKTFGEIADVLGKKQKACREAWRRWNDKQNCMRELLAGMDHSGSTEVEPKEVNEEGIRLCHATGIA